MVYTTNVVLTGRHPRDWAATLLAGEAIHTRVAERIARQIDDGWVGALLAADGALAGICVRAEHGLSTDETQ